MIDRKVKVYLHDRPVGTVAETTDHRIAFAYSDYRLLIAEIQEKTKHLENKYRNCRS